MSKELRLRHEYRQQQSFWSISDGDQVLIETRSIRAFRKKLNDLAGARQHVPNDDQTGIQWEIGWIIYPSAVGQPR